MEDKNTNAVNIDAEFEVVETTANGTEVSLKFDTEVGTISYSDISKLPQFITWFIKDLLPQAVGGIVPSDAVSEENYAEAKKVRTRLNSLKDKLNAERIRIHNLWEAPYDAFKKEFDEKTGLLTAAIFSLDRQLKAIEEAQKTAKRDALVAEIKKKATAYRVEFDKLLESSEALWNRVWKKEYANKSVSTTKIQSEYILNLLAIHDELQTIEKMPDSDSILQAYYREGDLSKAIREAQAFKERKEEDARRRDEEDIPQSPSMPPHVEEQPQPTAPQILQPEEGDIVKVFKVWHKSPREFHDLIEYMKAHGFHACIIK